MPCLQQKPAPSQQDIEDIFGGNLCRCTGYRPILHAMRTLAHDYDAATDGTQKCLIDPAFPIQFRKELGSYRPGLSSLRPASRRAPFISAAAAASGFGPTRLPRSIDSRNSS